MLFVILLLKNQKNKEFCKVFFNSTKKMNKYIIRRYFLFIISLFINAFGIAFITKAMLGTSPITSVTYVLSMFTPYTMGIWTIIINILFVVLELFFMTRKDLKSDLRMYLFQIPISCCFGLFIDFSMYILSWLNPSNYLYQIAVLILGCIILAACISLEVKANAAMMSGEYFVNVITRRFHKEFGYVKLGFDITLLVIACVLSLIFMDGIHGVREGTITAAILVGPIVHFISPYYSIFDKWIINPEIRENKSLKNNNNIIITIAREYGSGGHLLAEMLSKQLGIKFYDKEFIEMAALRCGIDKEYIIKNEQSIPSFWLKCILSRSSEQSMESSLSSDDVLFLSESKIIQELAEKESCIIVGRCADFILKEYPKVLKIFCYCDINNASERCTTLYGLEKGKAEIEIKRINHNRIRHYEYYTGEKWGEAHRYDIMLNTGSIDIYSACQIVKTVYCKMQNKPHNH